MKKRLYYLLCQSKGGHTRARILEMIKDKPSNANMIAESLQLDYKTIRHHLDVMLKNNLIIASSEDYGATYSISNVMLANLDTFKEVCMHIKNMGETVF